MSQPDPMYDHESDPKHPVNAKGKVLEAKKYDVTKPTNFSRYSSSKSSSLDKLMNRQEADYAAKRQRKESNKKFKDELKKKHDR